MAANVQHETERLNVLPIHTCSAVRLSRPRQAAGWWPRRESFKEQRTEENMCNMRFLLLLQGVLNGNSRHISHVSECSNIQHYEVWGWLTIEWAFSRVMVVLVQQVPSECVSFLSMCRGMVKQRGNLVKRDTCWRGSTWLVESHISFNEHSNHLAALFVQIYDATQPQLLTGCVCSGFLLPQTPVWTVFTEATLQWNVVGQWVIKNNPDIVLAKVSHFLLFKKRGKQISLTFTCQRMKETYQHGYHRWLNKQTHVIAMFCQCVASQTVLTDEFCTLNKNIHIIAGMWHVLALGRLNHQNAASGCYTFLTHRSVSVCGVRVCCLGTIDPA